MRRLDSVHRHDEWSVEVGGAEELEGVCVGVAGELVALALEDEDLEAKVLEFPAAGEVLPVNTI